MRKKDIYCTGIIGIRNIRRRKSMTQRHHTFSNRISGILQRCADPDSFCRAKRCAPLLVLVLLFTSLIILMVPSGCVFGSHTDWLNQHVTLAETIRRACLEQHTLLPGWLELGGGANGYQFSYYGYLRPDIIIGCLLPRIPMAYILIAYMLAVYLASVLICFFWMRSEGLRPLFSFIGSVLLLTAGCMFHMHRQIMFVSYMPYLLLAFLCISKRRLKWLPLCFTMIFLHSFYFAAAALAAVGWYWLRRDGRLFWKKYFLKGYLCSGILSAAISAALLLPTALVLLEHRRSGSSPSLLELFGPNPVLNNLLFNEYGMGLSLICLYAILAGLSRKTFRADSILFLLMGLFGIFSYIMNLTLYIRPKILMPFVPLVLLLCVRFLQTESEKAAQKRKRPWPLWPFAVMLPVVLLWFSQEQFLWGMLEFVLLLIYCLKNRYGLIKRLLLSHRFSSGGTAGNLLTGSAFFRNCLCRCLCLVLLLAAPVRICLATAETEDWVKASELYPGLSEENLQEAADLEESLTDPLYRFDSLTEPLNSSNELLLPWQAKTTMYSSVTNPLYSEFYYDFLMTPIQIRNRVALLPADNPFLFSQMGVRWLETTADQVPEGYEIIYNSAGNVIAGNPDVLPKVYFTEDTLSRSVFDTLDSYDRLDALSRFTVINDSVEGTGGTDKTSGVSSDGNTSAGLPAYQSCMEKWNPDLSASRLPEGLKVTETPFGWQIDAEEKCTMTVNITQPPSGQIVLLDFKVDNLTSSAVIIDINNIRNKLSDRFAPYPNGNTCFHYQFTETPGRKTDQLEITFGKGNYAISDVHWHLYDAELLNSKSCTPLKTDTQAGTFAAPAVISGTVNAQQNGYLATSIPVQNGLEILVDGRPSELVTVNCAFAGTRLEEGTHEIEIRFIPPGKTAGCIISAAGTAAYGLYLLLKAVKKRGIRL